MRANLAARALMLALAAAPLAAAQEPGTEALPRGDVFPPLAADPKQPQFFGAFVWTTSADSTTPLASIGLGENIGLLRGRARHWQLSLATGVFSQFDMRPPSYNLLNSDFVVGLPFTWRQGRWSARVRLYHQSSHLGDEYLLATGPERVNLSFEALELIAAFDAGAWRAYAGGERLIRRDPTSLKPGLWHAGLEYRGAAALVRLGRLGGGRVLVALDTKLAEQRRWQVAWSARVGLEFQPADGGPDAGRRWSVQLHAFDGPAPYGQFYGTNVRALGAGLHFSL
jgi:hypothetical protein